MKIIRILPSFICICIIVGIFPILVNAGYGEDISKRVEVSDFRFTNEAGDPVNSLTDHMAIKAVCNIKRTERGEGKQDYVFALVIYDGGKIKTIKTSKGSVAIGEKIPISVSAVLGDNVSQYRVAAFLWSNFWNMDLLASPAYFGSSGSALSHIKINGSSIGEIYDGKTEYDYELAAANWGIPQEVFVQPKDLAAQIEVTNATEFPGAIQIKVISHNKEEITTYQVNLKRKEPITIAVPAMSCASKLYYQTTLRVNTIPSTETDYITIRTNNTNYTGSSSIAFIKFDLPLLPEGAYMSKIKLKINAKMNGTGNTVDAFLGTDNSWDTDPKYHAAGFPPFSNDTLSLSAIEIAGNNTYQIYEIDLNKEMLKDKTTVTIVLRKNYISTATSDYLYVDIRGIVPVVEMEYYE